MARAHLFKPVTDEFGNLLYGASVMVRKSDVSDPVDQTIYSASTGGGRISNPMIIGSGFVDFWLDTPERVNLFIQMSGRSPISIFIDVLPAAKEIVRTIFPLTITNAPLANKMLLATSDTEAAWAYIPVIDPGTIPPHFHAGLGIESVALGVRAAAGNYGTAVGVDSNASGIESTAFGHLAKAVGAASVAVGHNAVATGNYTISIGYDSQAGLVSAVAIGAYSSAASDRSIAIGYGASASGLEAVALGHTASASSDTAVAIGFQSSASSALSIAIGSAATANYANSVALGAGVATTAINQIMLGKDTQTILALGAFQALGNSALVGATGTLGFFNATGATRRTVTGSDGGNLVLRSLLVYLDDIGLIINGSTP